MVGTLNLLDAHARRRREAGSSSRAPPPSTASPTSCRSPRRVPTRPINPYGFTKLAIERALADYAHAYGLGYTVLRYFNACGASSDATIGEDHTPKPT